ncbi:MAG: transcription termination/antitermination protein NusA [Candidatus Dormibacteria bacterium]
MVRSRPDTTLPDPGSDLLEAVTHLAEEAGIAEGELGAVVAAAILDTYRRFHEDAAHVSIDIDLHSGRQTLRRGDEVLEPLRGDAARQAAQAVRVAVIERLREAGVARVLAEAAMLRGQLIDTIVERRAGRTWILRTPDLEVVLPPEEQTTEELEVGSHLKVVILDGRKRADGAVLVGSRSHPHLVRLLLEQEVPELGSGQVIIRGIAREAGRRSKVAVDTTDEDIDPQGACIGPRGIRHRAVTAELGAEQLQIVRWSDDIADLVANSLIPATVLSVHLDEETRTAAVRVDAGQLSLAIGRGGENARLAARLTGWRIDIGAQGGDGA